MIGSTKQRLGGRCENNGIFGKLMLFLAALPEAVTGAEVGERGFRTLLLIAPLLMLAVSPDRGSGQAPTPTLTVNSSSQITVSWSGSAACLEYLASTSATAPSDWAGSAAVEVSGTSQAVTGLTASTKYWFRLWFGAFAAGECMGAEGTAVAATTQAATKAGPTSVAAAFSADSSSISLSWTAPSPAPTGYNIRLADASMPLETAHTSTSYTYSNVLKGTKYKFEVQAVYSDGTSAWVGSNEITTKSGPPQNVTATAQGPTSILVTWDLPAGGSEGREGFMVWYKEDGEIDFEPGEGAPLDQPNATSALIVGLVAETEYSVKVSVWPLDDPQNPIESGEVTVTTASEDQPTPGPPDIFEGRIVDKEVELTWDEPEHAGTSALTHYAILRGSTSPPTDSVAVVAADARDLFYLETLTPGQDYYFAVVAANDSGRGAPTAPYHARVEVRTDPEPTAPSGLFVVLTEDGDPGILVAWTPPEETGSSAIARYIIYGGTTNPPADSVGGVTGTSFTYRPITPGTTYWFRIKAVNADGHVSPFSDARGRHVPAQTDTTQVRNLSATGGQGQVVLTWQEPSGSQTLKHYQVQFATTASGTFANLATTTPATKTYTHTGLGNGVSRSYRVAAVDMRDTTGTWSATATATTTAVPTGGTDVPSAPRSLTATLAGSDVRLRWQAATDSGSSAITGYRIEQSQDGSSWTTEATVGASVLTYTYSNPPLSSTIRYRVFALNVQGSSAASNTASVTTGTGLPAAPTDLTVRFIESNVSLSWSAPSRGSSAITAFKIEYDDGSGWTTLAQIGTVLTYLHTNVEPGKQYRYRVFAINSQGTSPASNEVSITSEVQIASAPLYLSAIADGSDVSLSWTAPLTTGGGEITGYQIEVSVGAGVWTTLVSNTGPVTTHSHSELKPGTRLRYRVAAINEAGIGPLSGVVEVVIDAVRPGIPTGVHASARDYQTIDISWAPPEDDGGNEIISYQIQTSLNGTSWHVLATDIAASARRFTHTNLDPATTHHYRIFAKNEEGLSGASTIVQATTEADLPDKPTSINATAEGSGAIHLSWRAPVYTGGAEITGYRVETSGDAQSWQTLDDNIEALFITHTNLDPATTYYYRVFARNSVGLSTASVMVQATTEADLSGRPTSVSATAEESDRVRLSWGPPDDDGGSGVIAYQIDTSRDGTSWHVLAMDISASARVFIHKNLDPATTHYYRIFARNSVGLSTASAIVQATTEADLPDRPTSVNAVGEESDRIHLSWLPPVYTGGVAITGYQIETSDDGRLWTVLRTDIDANARAFVHMNLDPATTHYYRIFARNSVGLSTASAAVNAATKPALPGKVMDLGARAVSSSEILLGWSPVTSTGGVGLLGYRIEISLDAGATWQVVRRDTGTLNTAYHHKDLRPGTTYRYRVSALNMVGYGESSEYAETRTHGPPQAPKDLIAETVSQSQINLAWIPPDNNGGTPLTGYLIEFSADGGGEWNKLTETAVGTSYAHKGLRAGTTYRYRVSAINGIGIGEASGFAETRTLSSVADPPRGLIAVPAGHDRIELSWQVPAFDGGVAITGYQIELLTDDGALWLVVADHVEGIRYLHSGLLPATSYTYRVSAINEVGTGKPSLPATAETDVATPSQPRELKAEARGSVEIRLDWLKPDRNGGTEITGYRIQVSTDRGGTWQTVLDNTASTKLSYLQDGLEPGLFYRYRVAAINATGLGDWSIEAEAKTYAVVPEAPRELIATTGLDQIQLMWLAPEYDGGAPVTGYVVEVATDGREWAALGEPEDLSFVHDEPERGLAWSYRVSAVNEAGRGPASESVTAMLDDPTERAARVTDAILPIFGTAATSSSVRAISTRVQAVSNGDLSLERVNLQGGRDGLIGLANGSSIARRSSGLSLWASADLTGMSNGGTIKWEGEVLSVHAGMDGMIRKDMLIGVSGARTSGSFDFTDRTHGREVSGLSDASVTSVTPYLAWIREDASVWTLYGSGWGSFILSDSLAGSRESRFATTTIAAGGMRNMGRSRIGAFGLRAEGFSLGISVAGNGEESISTYLNETSYTIRRARLMLDWAVVDYRLGSSRTEVVFRTGARQDWSNVADRLGGTEIGGEVRFESSVFRVRGDGRMLIHPSYREWGLRGMFELRSGNEQGLSVRLEPSYGAAQDGIDALWHEGAGTMTPLPGRQLEIKTAYKPSVFPLAAYSRYNSSQKTLIVGTRFQTDFDWLIEGRHTDRGLGVSIKGSRTFN